MADRVFSAASISLALAKYWGKADAVQNTPATTSIAVTLSGLETRTAVHPADRDVVSLEGVAQPPERFLAFFDTLRATLDVDTHFAVKSYNTFPTAAGLASSSSGFAALAAGCAWAAGVDPSAAELSRIARVGSASAARAVFGGFTRLSAEAREATQLFPREYWPELRIVAVAVSKTEKPVSSRAGMSHSRDTSPYYVSWVADSAGVAAEVEAALETRDLERLGGAMRLSYLRMVATMISASPPFLYWLPETIAVIRRCEELRAAGVPAWETTDAGPQVKIVTTEDAVDRVRTEVFDAVPHAEVYETAPGPGVRRIGESEYTEGLQ